VSCSRYLGDDDGSRSDEHQSVEKRPLSTVSGCATPLLIYLQSLR